jgi:hypothetical protein
MAEVAFLLQVSDYSAGHYTRGSPGSGSFIFPYPAEKANRFICLSQMRCSVIMYYQNWSAACLALEDA